MVNLEDLQKLDIRIAKVLEAERVPDTDKLLKMKVDIGTEQRTIVSGIALSYSPEDMIGREIVVIVNLEPRTIKGIESQGMLFATKEEGRVVLLKPDSEVTPGSSIR